LGPWCVPPGTASDVDPATGQLVDVRHLGRQRTRIPGRRRWARRPEPDTRGLTRQSRQGDPSVRRPGQSVAGAHGQVVVGPEEGVEAEFLGGLCHAEEVVVVRALLWFGENPQLHALQLSIAALHSHPRRRNTANNPPQTIAIKKSANG